MTAEVNHKATGLRWRARPARKLKFVDDGLILSKINMRSAPTLIGQTVQKKHDIITQNMFRRIVRKAESRGMVVNNKKTKILCMSDAMSYEARAYILDAGSKKLESTDSCLLYTSPSPRDRQKSRMPSSA